MSLETLLGRCQALAEDPDFKAPQAWKKEHPGATAFGYFPVYAPVEIFHATGALPLAVLGAGSLIEVDHADSRIQSFVCSITRSTLELGLTRRLDMLDGMVFSSICDAARNLSGVWGRNFPEMLTDYLHYPQNMTSPSAVAYYRGELRRLADAVAKRAGQPLEADSLRTSIALYNESRRLLRDLYRLRREAPWNCATWEAYLLARAGAVLPVEEHNALLAEALPLLAGREGRPLDRVRVVLEGSFCEQPPLDLLRVIEEAGCYIVDDDLLLGLRWFSGEIAEDGDPLGALAVAYLRQSALTAVRHHGPEHRGKRLLEKVARARAGGVVFCAAKFCEPALMDYVVQKSSLEEARIPFLSFEFEEKMGMFESIRTQVETFVESILFFS